jgi:hypothetical protein
MWGAIAAGLKALAAFFGLIEKGQDAAKAADQQAAGAAKVTAADDRAAAESMERQVDAIVNAGPGRGALEKGEF